MSKLKWHMASTRQTVSRFKTPLWVTGPLCHKRRGIYTYTPYSVTCKNCLKRMEKGHK